MAADPFYKSCCLQYVGGCAGRIEWHHNLIVAGKQSNLKSTILPLCEQHHAYAYNPEIKDLLDHVMLERMSDDEIQSVSKAIDYARRKKVLAEKFKHLK